MNADQKTLYYVYDPMCSWCWGFSQSWKALEKSLPTGIKVQYVLGGLAPDSDKPMPQDMQKMLAKTWQTVAQKIPGTQFNYDFWTHAKPRRSTYPACRAIIATRLQDKKLERAMLQAIQHAYYLNAQNPSDNSTLIELAKQIGLDDKQFHQDLISRQTQKQLIDEIKFARLLNAQGFPSLILKTHQSTKTIAINYNNASTMLAQIAS